MIILGAGLAGLLAAHYFRDQHPTVLEARSQEEVANTHSALFRLRSDALGRITGVKLRKVQVLKGVFSAEDGLRNESNLQEANSYAFKVSGKVQARSILSTAAVTRWVPEEGFMERLSKGLDIKYDTKWGDEEWKGQSVRPTTSENVISTIPMTFLHNALNKFSGSTIEAKFEGWPIDTLNVDLGDFVDVHQTIYFPSTKTPVYRASITGSRLTVELIDRQDKERLKSWDAKGSCDRIAKLFLGFPCDINPEAIVRRTQMRGKIDPLPTELRRRITMLGTDVFNVYSVGRFATWRQLLIDDVIGDLEKVRSLIEGGSRYGRLLQYA